MNVIFLDIDGVLNSEKSVRQTASTKKFLPETVAAFNSIVERTAPVIAVISSTWRKVYSIEEIAQTFRENGILPCISGQTPILDRTRESGILVSPARGAEIRAWLDAFPAHRYGSLHNYVILDDDDDMEDLVDHLVQTDWKIGLTQADADRAVKLLNGL